MGTELEGAGGYRVGDADRNRVADLLKEAHAAGYLTLEEVDERLDTAASWTGWSPTSRPSGGPARGPAGRRPGHPHAVAPPPRRSSPGCCPSW